ncbi:GNAT family N-acetyltransferase [Streptomyces sp. NBC_01506]|uniref:GNAT family N-acetyltransferase n=1 Tax=Streptomyces sp. NBC_01506 TaxID=2903887 RepID=UPI00386FE81B
MDMDMGRVDGPGGPRVRRADVSDGAALAEIDSVAAAGDHVRRDSIRRWCEHGLVLLAEDDTGPLGYSVLEYTFFEQGFLTLLMVAPGARRRGVGARLLAAVESTRTTPKLFTSTNVSNHPMRRLLGHANWRPAGILHGLDEGDPELFFLCPRAQSVNDKPLMSTSATFSA